MPDRDDQHDAADEPADEKKVAPALSLDDLHQIIDAAFAPSFDAEEDTPKARMIIR